MSKDLASESTSEKKFPLPIADLRISEILFKLFAEPGHLDVKIN